MNEASRELFFFTLKLPNRLVKLLSYMKISFDIAFQSKISDLKKKIHVIWSVSNDYMSFLLNLKKNHSKTSKFTKFCLVQCLPILLHIEI